MEKPKARHLLSPRLLGGASHEVGSVTRGTQGAREKRFCNEGVGVTVGLGDLVSFVQENKGTSASRGGGTDWRCTETSCDHFSSDLCRGAEGQ